MRNLRDQPLSLSWLVPRHSGIWLMRFKVTVRETNSRRKKDRGRHANKHKLAKHSGFGLANRYIRVYVTGYFGIICSRAVESCQK
jgi:hypothetical protein